MSQYANQDPYYAREPQYNPHADKAYIYYSGNCCGHYVDQILYKPFKVFGTTMYRWWPPRLCLLLCLIFYLVLSLGFRITINQSVFDLNENVAARGVMWHVAGIFASVIIAFYVFEWTRYGQPLPVPRDPEYIVAGGDPRNDFVAAAVVHPPSGGSGGGGGPSSRGAAPPGFGTNEGERGHSFAAHSTADAPFNAPPRSGSTFQVPVHDNDDGGLVLIT